jgi:ribonuclease Z
MNFMRAGAVGLLVVAGIVVGPDLSQAQSITVTLLGTGGPPPSMERFGPSTLVEAGGQRFVFDAGRGALQRLTQAGVRWQQVDALLFTHLHSDHVVGFPDLWLTGWLVSPGRSRPLRVLGPTGTQDLLSHLRQAFQFDLSIRVTDDRVSPAGVEVLATDIEEGVVHDSGGVRITAFLVDHAPVEPALGYRIDYGGRSVVLSGDTRKSDTVVRYAQGVDLLVHEVASPETFARAGVHPERARSVLAHHATPEEAGEVFQRAKPALAVYSHIIQPTATDEDLLPPTRRVYSGRVEVGADLMVIIVGDTIEVRRPSS